MNHPFTNLDRDLFEDYEIDNLPDQTLINDKCKKREEKIEKQNIYSIWWTRQTSKIPEAIKFHVGQI